MRLLCRLGVMPVGMATTVLMCGCGSSSAAKTSAASDVTAIQSLGLPHAENSTPVLAASGQWVVAVWTAAEKDGTNVYAATSRDAGARRTCMERIRRVWRWRRLPGLNRTARRPLS
jgi:hypothetical protein